jgi:hypothetical protein
MDLNQIRKIIISDDYYIDSDEGSVSEIAKHTFTIYKMISGLESNKLNSNFDDEICFEPDKNLIYRETDFETAMIKYSAHFVTKAYRDKIKRSIDFSKIRSLDKILETIIDADYRIEILNEKKLLRVILAKDYDGIHNFVITEKLEEKKLKVITFMPNQRKSRLKKKLASALKTEAKSTLKPGNPPPDQNYPNI